MAAKKEEFAVVLRTCDKDLKSAHNGFQWPEKGHVEALTKGKKKDSSKLAASGDYSKLAASGDSSKLAASGDSSKLAASGYYSQLAASGDSSQLAASGYYSQLAASGDSSIVVAAAPGCIASAGERGTIVLSRWVAEEKRYRVSVAYVGEDGIKPNVAYKLDDDGNFVEAAP